MPTYSCYVEAGSKVKMKWPVAAQCVISSKRDTLRRILAKFQCSLLFAVEVVAISYVFISKWCDSACKTSFNPALKIVALQFCGGEALCTPKTTTYLVVVNVHSWVPQILHTLEHWNSQNQQVYHMNLKNGQVWNMNIRELWKVHTRTQWTSYKWYILIVKFWIG